MPELDPRPGDPLTRALHDLSDDLHRYPPALTHPRELRKAGDRRRQRRVAGIAGGALVVAAGIGLGFTGGSQDALLVPVPPASSAAVPPSTTVTPTPRETSAAPPPTPTTVPPSTTATPTPRETSAAPPPEPATGSAGPETTARGATVPARFVGSYASSAAECGTVHELALRIGPDQVQFYESTVTVLSAREDDAGLTITGEQTSEGQTSTGTWRFSISTDGETLTDADTGAVRVRCP